MASHGDDFHLFVSYTRTPDATLAQEVERFLESFHKARLPDQAEPLPPLRVCVDGSDFSMPPVAERAARVREILDLVHAHLARARELLVLCSSGSARSKWVDSEIRWFIEHRGAARVRVAFTEGASPHRERERFFPAALLEHRLDRGLAYDLRGYDSRRAEGWHQVAEFSREMVRLAADLHGRSGGELYPTWLEAELERARRQSTTMASNARFQTFFGEPNRAVLGAYQAHQLYPDEASEAALRDAYRVAVLHHHNRRQIAQITGSGPGYLARRWKQGDLFSKASADGRYRLLVTERGRDGPHPPGNVFLLSNETLRAVELATEDNKYRVEDAAFDRTTQRVFVTRYFDLYVYSLDGALLAEYAFSRHTKSPIHLLDGLFHDRWILGAETKGGVWLVDPHGGWRATITVHGEFYGDATLVTDMSPNRRRMTLIYESGKANLLELDTEGKPRLRRLAEAGALFAGFPTGRDDRVVLTGHDGTLRVLEVGEDKIHDLLRTDAFGADVDWVSFDPETNRFALVGGDRAIHIADAESGLRIATLDFADAIDWRDAISVPVPHTFENENQTWERGEGVRFPSEELAVTDMGQSGDRTWIVTEEWPNEYWATHRVHLVEGDRAYFLGEGRAPISELDGILAPAGSRQIFLRAADSVRPFPAEEGLDVRCLLTTSGGLWVGTSDGAFRRRGDRFERMTPSGVSVEGLAEIDGTLWMSGRTGAYAFTEDRLLRVTDSFLQVTAIQKAGGHIWVLGATEGGGASPAWRVERWLASAFPHREACVSRILETPGAIWLVDQARMYRAVGDDWDPVETGLEVSTLEPAGGSIWCTTKQRGFHGAAGPLLRIDAGTLEVQPFDLAAPLLATAGGNLFVTHVVVEESNLFGTAMGKRAIARLDERAPQPIRLGDADVKKVIEHRGTVWLLTSAGAFRFVEGKFEQANLPALCYSGIASLQEATWLYAEAAGVRLRGDGVTVFETERAVCDVVRVRGDTWILTADNIRQEPGPAYRISGGKAVAHSPSEGGVTAVVEHRNKTWLLTKSGNRAGPMVVAEG